MDTGPSLDVTRILNVDDVDTSRRYKSDVLRSAGMAVDEASDGVQALEMILHRPPTLILLDVNLPGLDGFEVCRRVKDNPATEHIPVLHISSARVTDADRVKALALGADSHLIEPVAPEVLIATVRRLLHRVQVEHQLRLEQARIREVLGASESRYRSLFFHAPYGIYTTTADGRVLTANHALAQILDYDSALDVMALNAAAFYREPSDRAAMVTKWTHVGRVESDDVRWQRRTGEPIIVRLTGRVVAGHTPTEHTFEVFVDDVTARRQLETENRHAQKMDAIGQLSTGIAHDFNNLLTAILGYTELMLQQIDADKPIYRDLIEVYNAGKSAAALTQQLLVFAHKQTLQMHVVDMNAVLRAAEHLVRRVIGDSISVQVHFAPGPQAVHADPVQLEQVLVNLAVNGRDAMPNGGTLTFSIASVELRDPRPFPIPVRVVPGRYVRMTVADTGSGMDPHTQAHLFEPFFTTKGGGGTGLGLATVYGIVKQFGGYIWASSELEHGSTFTLYFPSTDAPVEAMDGAPARESREVGRETILVVEDESAVRALVASVLTRHGYAVLEAATPDAALALVGSRAVDLVVCDVVMPGMDGPTLIRRLRRAPEGLKRVIYMSAYASEDVTARLFGETASLLAKPFSQGDLLTTVRRVLDQPAEALQLEPPG